MEKVFQIQNKKGEWVDYEPGIVSENKLQELKSTGKFREKPQSNNTAQSVALPPSLGQFQNAAGTASNALPPMFGKFEENPKNIQPRDGYLESMADWSKRINHGDGVSVASMLNPFVFLEKANNVEGPGRPFAMAAGALADVGLTAFSPIRAGYNAVKAGIIGTKAATPIKGLAGLTERGINSVTTAKNLGKKVLTRAEQAAVGAAEAMLASGDISPETAAIGAFFGGTLGGNAQNNIINAERELVKFSKAPSYQQRWAKNYLKYNHGIDAKESPRAIRELVKKEMKAGENIETVINRNNSRLDELNSEMSNLLKTQKAGNLDIGIKFREFADDIKENVYLQGREIGSSEGKKLEAAIGEIMNDIRITQLEKKINQGEIAGIQQLSHQGAREFVERNLDELLDNIPLTLNDVNELKRAMQKRTSMYKRSSASQARAGVETQANAAGAKSINKEIDLLSDIPNEIMEQGKLLKEKIGDANLEILNGAIDLKALELSEMEKGLLEQYLKGDALKKYRAINNELSNLIGKNDIFETMLSKFEFRMPDQNFIPHQIHSAVNPIQNYPTAQSSRAVSRAGFGEFKDDNTHADSLSNVPQR